MVKVTIETKDLTLSKQLTGYPPDIIAELIVSLVDAYDVAMFRPGDTRSRAALLKTLRKETLC
jgi:hypothetical protein